MQPWAKLAVPYVLSDPSYGSDRKHETQACDWLRKVKSLPIWGQLVSSYMHARAHKHAQYSLLSHNALSSPQLLLLGFLMLSRVSGIGPWVLYPPVAQAPFWADQSMGDSQPLVNNWASSLETPVPA